MKTKGLTEDLDLVSNRFTRIYEEVNDLRVQVSRSFERAMEKYAHRTREPFNGCMQEMLRLGDTKKQLEAAELLLSLVRRAWAMTTIEPDAIY